MWVGLFRAAYSATTLHLTVMKSFVIRQAERRKTDEHRAALEREHMKARAMAEADGRIKEQRENEDLFLRQVCDIPVLYTYDNVPSHDVPLRCCISVAACH